MWVSLRLVKANGDPRLSKGLLAAASGFVVSTIGLELLIVGLRTTASHTVDAIYGVAISLLAAVLLGTVTILLYLNVKQVQADGFEVIRQRFQNQFIALAGVVIGSCGWLVLDMYLMPANRQWELNFLELPVILGFAGFTLLFYWKFRSEKIHAQPEGAEERRKVFQKREKMGFGLLYFSVIGPSMYADIRRGLSDGHRLTVIAMIGLAIVILAALIYRRRRKVAR
jgi:hypothetical protein